RFRWPPDEPTRQAGYTDVGPTLLVLHAAASQPPAGSAGGRIYGLGTAQCPTDHSADGCSKQPDLVALFPKYVGEGVGGGVVEFVPVGVITVPGGADIRVPEQVLYLLYRHAVRQQQRTGGAACGVRGQRV